MLVTTLDDVFFTRSVHMPLGDLWTGLLGCPQLWTVLCTAWRGQIVQSGLGSSHAGVLLGSAGR